jgi:catechol 2,3-dioxygenase-like lactoylglutathione lyase family enzyme
MPLTRIEHFMVLAEDMDASRDFYRDVLGFTPGFRPDLGFDGYWLYLGDTPCVHIADKRTYLSRKGNYGDEDPGAVKGGARVDHIAFNGQDCDAMVARMAARGVHVRPNEVPGGPRQLFVFDPDGVKIEMNFMS